jgi:trehalose 6-phosphate phosphatase
MPSLGARRHALFLDIDGTLLDLAPTPKDVVVPEGLSTMLLKLGERLGGALAIVSGRSIASIDSLFEPNRFMAVGCHGAEIRAKGTLDWKCAPLPTWVVERASALRDAMPGVIVEDKVFALSIHYRLAPDCEGAIKAQVESWRERLADESFTVLPGKFVLDIKPAAVSKGTAVRSLMALHPFAGRVPLFIGDDLTDQEVFFVLPEFEGIGISVGRRLEGAEFCFATPTDTREWLKARFHALKPGDTTRVATLAEG